MNQNETWLTVPEVAKTLDISGNKVRAIIEKGDLTAYKFGSQYKITQSDFDKYLRNAISDGKKN